MAANETLNNAKVLTFNGVNGATGGYLLPQVSPGELLSAARGQILDREHLSDLRPRVRQAAGSLRVSSTAGIAASHDIYCETPTDNLGVRTFV